MLGLECEEQTFIRALSISVSFCEYLYKYDARKKISDITSTKEELEKVAEIAGHLVKFLESNPIASHLVWLFPKTQDDLLDFVSAGGIQTLREGNPQQLEKMIGGLEIIAEMAEHYSRNDEHLRSKLYLPRIEDAGKLPYVARFWPSLLFTWTDAGKDLAFSPGGPLHRFFSLVHEACDLPEVKASTLRDAVENSKSLGMKPRSVGNLT
jgi:hypothetical protein